MNLPPDYHTHNYLCRHAEGKLTEYAKAALQIGVAEIGFSDHAPMEQDPFDSWRMLRTELPCYLQMLEQARTEYPQLTIRAGLEVDYIPGMESWIKELAGLYDWDYFIGSVHYLDNGWDIDNPEKKYATAIISPKQIVDYLNDKIGLRTILSEGIYTSASPKPNVKTIKKAGLKQEDISKLLTKEDKFDPDYCLDMSDILYFIWKHNQINFDAFSLSKSRILSRVSFSNI